MTDYIQRKKERLITKHLKSFPCVAILGSRQVGKSTLAKHIIKSIKNSIYLDLEDPRDLAKLQEPMRFLEANRDSLICIDEVQRAPEIFSQFRSFLDQNSRPGQLLLLGSASRDLIKQSSETLAGRISYIEITPFSAAEVNNLDQLWLQGGYPSSYQLDIETSFDWRINYIRTFLERDIPSLGINIPAERLKRFWTMLAHLNGTIINQKNLASSMGVSAPTIKSYLDLLEGTFVLRQLKPFHTNTGKRLVKSPKFYLRDSGIIHCLLGIETFNDLLSHPILGKSYETFIIESILESFPRFTPSFYRTSSGSEIDLILEKGNKKIAIEIKSSSTPVLKPGFYEALKIINPDQAFVVASIKSPYVMKNGIQAYDLSSVLKMDL